MKVIGSLKVDNAVSASQFSGSGAQLFDISASAIVGLNLARISTGSVSASAYSEDGTGSLHFTDDSYFTGSLTIKGNLYVEGAQVIEYITSSQLDISTNIIGLNASSPGVRYGGLAVYDSGSTNTTGSLLWDSVASNWIYANPSSSISASVTQSLYKGGLLLAGPLNTTGSGSEQGINQYAIPVGQGRQNLTSSALVVSESKFISTLDTIVSGTLAVTGTATTIGRQVVSGTLFVSNSLIVDGTQTLTGSFNLTGSLIASSSEIHMYQSTSVSGTNIFGTSSWSTNTLQAANSDESVLLKSVILNKTTQTILKGQVVTIEGEIDDSMIVSTASFDSEARSKNTLGLAIEDIANDASGSIITQGLLTGINTIDFAEGDTLYLGPTGSIVNVKPASPNRQIVVGTAVKIDATDGYVYVKVTTPGGLDVVDLTTTASYGDLIIKSGSVWKSGNQLTGSYGLSGSITLWQSASVSGTNVFGTASWSDSSSFAVEAEKAVQVDVKVQNKTGFSIPKGRVVRISGSVGDNPLVTTASYIDDANSANTLGITIEAIANDGSGSVITTGVLKGINTSGYVAGDLIYLGPNGTIINSPSVAPLHTVRLGEVLRVHASQGSIFVSINNGYEIGELHDVVDNSTTASFGTLLVKSGSVWKSTNQLTGSYGLSGSITMWQSASVSGANLIGTASQAETASWVEARISKEWHVSSGSGNDTTGDGSILRPFKTLARASSSLGNTGERIVLHPGTYTEHVTFPQLNFTMTTMGTAAPGDVFVNGMITLSGNSSSNKLSGFTVSDLVQSGNGNLYLNNITVVGTTLKLGTGYFEAIDSAISQNSTVTVFNSGTCVFQGGKVGLLTQTHASSVVSILNCMTVVRPVVNSGTLLLNGSFVYSLSSGSAAVSSSAASTVFLQNSSMYNPNGGAERVILGGPHGLDDVIMNRDNSTFGTSLVAKAHFQHAQATAVTSSGLLVTTETVLRGNTHISSSAMTPGSGEGGQLNFALAPATSSLTGSVVMDIFQNRLRIFEEGGSNRGGFFDISLLSPGVGTDLGSPAAAVVVSGSFPTGSNRAGATGSASGSLWWNTEDGNLYIQVETPTGSEYVPAMNSVAGGNYGATVITPQTTAATTWVVPHNLNTSTPIVMVYTGSQVMIPDSITATTPNLVTITFLTATVGTSVISTGVGGPTSGSVVVTATSADTATSASFAQTASFSSQINDRGSSGFMDIGSVRYQWGVESSINATGTTTLPAAFANANYSVVLTAQNSNTANVMATSYHTRATTSFAWVKRLLTGGTLFDSTGPFSWTAIGLKP